MKALLQSMVFVLVCFGCNTKQKTSGNGEAEFTHVADYPLIQDSAEFILDLKEYCDLEVDENSTQISQEKVTTYKKVNLYGSEDDFIFIEYDYNEGCGAAFPWKYQILLTAEGKLLKVFSGLRFEFVEIFQNEYPFLMIVSSTSKGNGRHEIFKINGDTLEELMDYNTGPDIKTYDAHEDNSINEPNELTLDVKDWNNDGFNDISFEGKIVFLEVSASAGDRIDGKSIDNSLKKIPIQYIFLYNKQTGHFTPHNN